MRYRIKEIRKTLKYGESPVYEYRIQRKWWILPWRDISINIYTTSPIAFKENPEKPELEISRKTKYVNSRETANLILDYFLDRDRKDIEVGLLGKNEEVVYVNTRESNFVGDWGYGHSQYPVYSTFFDILKDYMNRTYRDRVSKTEISYYYH